jgi:aminopeptidase N
MQLSYRFGIGGSWRRVLAGAILTSLGCAIFLGLSHEPARAGEVQDWPILRHDIRVAIEPARSWIEVTDVIDLTQPPSPSQPLYLLLHCGLEVESVDIAGTPLKIEVGTGFKPRHFWKRPDYERLESFAVARELTVHPPAAGWPDEPRITLHYAGAVYDSLRSPKVSYGRGFETTSGLIDGRGAYLEGATFWIPWSAEDLFRYRLEASVPPGWESLTQGTWAKRSVAADGRVESVWVVDDPMDEAYLVAGPYVVREAIHGDVTAYTFTYENTPDTLCRTYLDATARYIELYEEMIGPYPFDKFAMVENWWQTGFGMPSFTLLGDRVIRLPFIVHTSFGHEILHNWWGNSVFVDVEKGNWCEGLTTYLADYSYKERENAASAREYRLKQLQAYLDYASTGEHDFALRGFTERESASTQAVGYGKTMMVFHMTRQLLGDDTFFDGLRQFYKENRFKEASWDDVVHSFDAASGRSLEAWFEQWIGRPGAPVLSVTRREGGPGGVTVELRQEEPFYEVEVPVSYEIHGKVRSRTVPMNGATFELELPQDTRWVAVDPDFQIFRKLHRGEIPPALSQVLGSDSTMVVIGSDCAPDVADALRALAEKWSHNHNQIVVEEAEFAGSNGRGVWFFGEGAAADRIFAETRSFGDLPQKLRTDASAAGRTLVACFRDGGSEGIPWTVVLPSDASVVEALGRKLPHYGGYSYLVFDGETNAEKGSWAVMTSPLRLSLMEE